MHIRPFRAADEARVIELWHACNLVVPWNDPHTDISLKIALQPDLFLVACDADGRVIGTVMVGWDGHRGAINYLGVHPAHRQQGVGRLLMHAAEERLRALGCPKINLLVRQTNVDVIAFYERVGYKLDPTVCLGKRL